VQIGRVISVLRLVDQRALDRGPRETGRRDAREDGLQPRRVGVARGLGRGGPQERQEGQEGS
jgi:hypothetical protein